MLCPRCQAAIAEGARFCARCGTTLAGRRGPIARPSGASSPCCSAISSTSTALSVRLDPEDLREVMRAYQKYVSDTVARFGGVRRAIHRRRRGGVFRLAAGARARRRTGGARGPGAGRRGRRACLAVRRRAGDPGRHRHRPRPGRIARHHGRHAQPRGPPADAGRAEHGGDRAGDAQPRARPVRVSRPRRAAAQGLRRARAALAGRGREQGGRPFRRAARHEASARCSAATRSSAFCSATGKRPRRAPAGSCC